MSLGRFPLAKTVGLRTQILVNLIFLMGAALLLSGIFLLRQTEREFVEQKVLNATAIANVLATSLAEETTATDKFVLHAAALAKALTTSDPVAEWSIVNPNLVALDLPQTNASFQLELAELSQVRTTGKVLVLIHYSSIWMPWDNGRQSLILLTVPFMHQGKFFGALQARLPLSDVRATVTSLQGAFLLYLLLYGAILVLFGKYLLGRTVVNPVRRLMSLTRTIASGDLAQSLPVEGPTEIAELAASFNAMTTSLRESRDQSEAHIRSLHQANDELKQAQEQLVRSAKMASVGQLAAGMAHEIGNPLGAVLGYLQYLKTEVAPLPTGEIVQRTLVEAQRIDRLLRDLLDYAAPAGDQPDQLDPGAVLAEARDLLHHQGAFDGVQVSTDLPARLPLVQVVRHKLLQVFVNLLLNARDAVAAAGTVRLAAGSDEASVWLSITDDGVGMDPKTLSHLFDPFYTTKAPGKGRGLGLSVCHRIIEEAGGQITVESQLGSGTRFCLRLPRAEG